MHYACYFAHANMSRAMLGTIELSLATHKQGCKFGKFR